MKVTVLGSAASYAGPGQACSGYLVEGGGARLLLDCGNGVIANLARVADPLALDAVLVTHAHPDHCADLFCLQALLRYSPAGPAPALRVWGPAGLLDRLGCMLSERGRHELAEAFEGRELAPGTAQRFGGLEVTAHRVDHGESAFALVARLDDRAVCYSGDAAGGDALVDAARGCDLLLAEATLPERYAGAAPHMTASEAGRVAEEAGAGRLALVHVWPTNDPQEILEAAKGAFSGPVSIAREFDVFDI